MRGGYRHNAGRKKGFAAKNAEEARRVLSDMVLKEIGPIGRALISRAKKGEVPAIREIFDRAFGKSAPNWEIDPKESSKVPTITGMQIVFDPVFKKEFD